MSWFDLPRIPEPEVMDDSGEVEAYSSAAAQAHLNRIDDTFVEHALRMVGSRSVGRALDIGTGPGQIVWKLAGRLPGWRCIGVDRSLNMIRQARASAPAPAPVVGAPCATRKKSGDAPHSSNFARRMEFLVADAGRLPFPDATFDLVMCNSVLHHVAHPERLLSEIARLAKPSAAVLLRDLRRPSRLAYPLHVRWHGRHYSGLMYTLFCASVRAAYTVQELGALLRASPLAGTGSQQGRAAYVFTRGRIHLGLERPAS